jgi:hypothetical protein
MPRNNDIAQLYVATDTTGNANHQYIIWRKILKCASRVLCHLDVAHIIEHRHSDFIVAILCICRDVRAIIGQRPGVLHLTDWFQQCQYRVSLLRERSDNQKVGRGSFVEVLKMLEMIVWVDDGATTSWVLFR